MSNDKELRKTVTFTSKRHLQELCAWAKDHKLTQGEVIEVLLDNVYDIDLMKRFMNERREEKVAGRTSIRAIIQRQKKAAQGADK